MFRDGYIRFEERYCLDPENLNFGFSGLPGLPEEDVYITQRSQQLAMLVGQSTLGTITAFADRIDDRHTLDMLTAGALDLGKALQRTAAGEAEQTRMTRLYGALQLPRNWDRVEQLLAKYAGRLAKAEGKQPVMLTWLAPAAHGLWGKYARHGQALSSFVHSARTKINGQEKTVFSPRLLIPLGDQTDQQARSRAFNECKEAESVLHGFIESSALSALEIVSLTESFAIVIYHLVQPDLHPVPVPFGFMTEDKGLIRRIETAVEDVLAEYTDGNVPRYLGALTKNPSSRKRG